MPVVRVPKLVIKIQTLKSTVMQAIIFVSAVGLSARALDEGEICVDDQTTDELAIVSRSL